MEPTLSDHSARALEIEFMLSEEPYVKALTDLDGDSLARGVQPTFYRVESVACFGGLVLTAFTALFLCIYSPTGYRQLSEEQKAALQEIDKKEAETHRLLRERRGRLEEKKRRNRAREEAARSARDSSRRMISRKRQALAAAKL